jgi:hypothetical protein
MTLATALQIEVTLSPSYKELSSPIYLDSKLVSFPEKIARNQSDRADYAELIQCERLLPIVEHG